MGFRNKECSRLIAALTGGVRAKDKEAACALGGVRAVLIFGGIFAAKVLRIMG
jgi:hypothetical protein